MFYYVWGAIRELPGEEVDKQWARYIAEREAMGQPVNPDTGKPLKRHQAFDPVTPSQREDKDDATVRDSQRVGNGG